MKYLSSTWVIFLLSKVLIKLRVIRDDARCSLAGLAKRLLSGEGLLGIWTKDVARVVIHISINRKKRRGPRHGGGLDHLNLPTVGSSQAKQLMFGDGWTLYSALPSYRIT